MDGVELRTVPRPAQASGTVVFTGRLASMRRRDAMHFVAEAGNRYSDSVTRQTALLVVGLDGFPVLKTGRVSSKLRKARQLQAEGVPLEILREDEWLDRLGLRDLEDSIRGRYTLDQMGGLVGVSGARVRQWLRAGLVRPVASVRGMPVFDFPQLSAIRQISRLVDSGVSVSRIRRSLDQLAGWNPEAGEMSGRLALLDGDSLLVMRDEEGRLSEPTGQRLLGFEEEEAEEEFEPSIPWADEFETAEELFARALELSEADRHDEAADLYREWLIQYGPDADVCFNLGNVLLAMHYLEAAEERFHQVLEIDPDHAKAWCNLGNVRADRKDFERAIIAYRRALAAEPDLAEAMYNLADVLQDLGRTGEARPHWEHFLRLEPEGDWAHYARRCLYAG